ncbi:MAG: T9SS type A sorting domain-containing protein [bacterium]
MQKKLIFTCLIFILHGYFLNAQTFSTEVIASSGEVAAGEEAILSWTIGESFTEIFDDNSGFQTLGFHQTFTSRQPAINQLVEVVKFYPNPVYKTLHIQPSTPLSAVNIEVFSTTGKLVINKTVDLSEGYKLNLSKLENGIYQLRLTGDIKLNHKFVKLNN